MNRRPLGGILCSKDILETFYVSKASGRSFTFYGPLGGLLRFEDLEEDFFPFPIHVLFPVILSTF